MVFFGRLPSFTKFFLTRAFYFHRQVLGPRLVARRTDDDGVGDEDEVLGDAARDVVGQRGGHAFGARLAVPFAADQDVVGVVDVVVGRRRRRRPRLHRWRPALGVGLPLALPRPQRVARTRRQPRRPLQRQRRR